MQGCFYCVSVFLHIQMVCNKEADGTEKVVGLHLTGSNAGEVLQGFAVAME